MISRVGLEILLVLPRSTHFAASPQVGQRTSVQPAGAPQHKPALSLDASVPKVLERRHPVLALDPIYGHCRLR